MKLRRSVQLVLISTALVALASLAGVATANDRGVRGTVVPATSCRLFLGTAKFSGNFSWVSQSGESADIVCPLPLNNVDLGATTDDNDITQFRVHFREPDGAIHDNEVIVNLLKFTRSNGVLLSDTVCSFVSSPTTTNGTTTTVPCVLDVAGGGVFYNFLVGLASSSGRFVEFIGIDFPE